MKRRSPTLEGFRILFRVPALGLAEIAWRWSFGLAVVTLLAITFREYLSTLPVTAAEISMLRTRQPALILQAISRILEGSAPRAVTALILVAMGLTPAWIVLASLARKASLNTFFEYFRDGHHLPHNVPLLPLIGLNFLRAAELFAAIVASLGAMLLAGSVSSKANPSPGSAMLIFWMLALFIAVAWSMLNWFLSLASIFVTGDDSTTFEALASAADLCRDRPGPVMAIATWFGMAHAVVFIVASTVVAFPLAFAGLLPAAIVLGGVILVTLIYFAIVDFLHAGRLAAYVCMIREPERFEPSAIRLQPIPPSDDDILSDIPGLAEPAAG